MHANELIAMGEMLLVRGSLAFLLALCCDRLLRKRVPANLLRLCWLIAVFAWLVPWHLPLGPALPDHRMAPGLVAQVSAKPFSDDGIAGHFSPSQPSAWLWFLPLGSLCVASLLLCRTVSCSRRWKHRRLSLSPALLELLEECKARAGVTAPIGLIVDSDISTPAIYGWLRPKILVPASLAEQGSESHLRAVFLHELAHFKSADVPAQWMLSLAQVLCWINPLVHMHAVWFRRVCELAADERALGWMNEAERSAYGPALLATVSGHYRQTLILSQGILCLGESPANIKERLLMITSHKNKYIWPGLLALALIASLLVLPSRAFAADTEDARAAADKAAQKWTKLIDEGHYLESWNEAGALFKSALSGEQWTAALTQVRKPLGACKERKLLLAMPKSELPGPNGQKLSGSFVIIQYTTSFESLPAAIETITFSKEGDGAWHCIGYFIKPAK